MIETCLHDWGIEIFFTITVDSASSNDMEISYLKRKVVDWIEMDVFKMEDIYKVLCAFY